MNTKTIIRRFGSAREMAEAIGVNVEAVHKWAQRGNIPGQYDMAIVRAAQARGLGLRLEDLAALRAALLIDNLPEPVPPSNQPDALAQGDAA